MFRERSEDGDGVSGMGGMQGCLDAICHMVNLSIRTVGQRNNQLGPIAAFELRIAFLV